MKYRLMIVSVFLSLLSGCGTINAERESYMVDKVYEKTRYFGDAVSSPEFSHYELRASYKTSDGKLLLNVDPVEINTQKKELYVINNEVSYQRYGPHRYNPALCVFQVVTVFNVLFSIIDDDYADNLKKNCYKVYSWKKNEEELPPEKAGVKAVETVGRNYHDTGGYLKFELFADGKKVNSMNLAGFKGDARSGAYTYTVNDWYDFSRLDENDSLKIKISNVRGSTYITKNLPIRKEDAELLVFKGKYDGAFRLTYTCTKCNANLTDNFYTDQEVFIWATGIYSYKGSGSLDYVSSCIEKRFDNLRHGHVWVEEASTPSQLLKEISMLSGSRVLIRGAARRPPKPDIDDIRSCIREERFLHLEVEEL